MTDEYEFHTRCNFIDRGIVEMIVDGAEPFRVATPKDFWPDSPDGVLSPEDLFVASLASCYGVTLTGAARRFHAELTDFQLEVSGFLQQGEFGWEFNRLTIKAIITVPTQKDKKKMAKAAERSHKYCVISNSMKCPVDLDYEIEVRKTAP